MPNRLPDAMVTTSTTSGFSLRVAPKAIGCTMFWSMPLARMTITSMTSAVFVPCDPSARITAKAPATKAPMNGM